MAILPLNKPYALKDRVERAIDIFAANDNPTQSDLDKVKTTAQIEVELDVYRASVHKMSLNELDDEVHQSARLALFMAASCNPRPHPLCHAHALISGAHKHAAELRAVMAWLRMRIDEPENGCWLPKNTAAKTQMPRRLSNAVPHSRIHRYNYYFWLNQLINPSTTDTKEKLRSALKMIAARLQSGKQPTYVMNKKEVGLPV